jgi:N-acetylglucosamine-6-sulfatase
MYEMHEEANVMKSRSALVAILVVALMPHAIAQTSAPATSQPVESATIPFIRPTEMSRHNEFLAVAKSGDIDLLFLGDSITDFWRREDRGLSVWNKYFAPLKAANFGISGDRTQNVLWRVQNGELDGFKAKCIVLMLGTNNLSTNRNTNEETIAGMKLVVGEIRKRQPQAKLLILGVFQRGGPTDQARPRLKIINSELSLWADNRNVFYMDIGDRFLNPDGSLKMELMNDPVHPNTEGYEVWADAIIGKVKELMAAN